MSGGVVGFGFVSKEEAQVKRYKKPLREAALKEKKESAAMEKWNKELAEMEGRRPVAEGVEPVEEAAVKVPELGVVPVAEAKAVEEECVPVVPVGVKTISLFFAIVSEPSQPRITGCRWPAPRWSVV